MVKKTKAKKTNQSKTRAKSKSQNLAAVASPSEEKQKIISKYATNQGDTGSPEVQAALLTERIERLVNHLKTNPSDNHSRRGLLGMVSKRRRLLNYLEKKSTDRYKKLIKELKLKK